MIFQLVCKIFYTSVSVFYFETLPQWEKKSIQHFLFFVTFLLVWYCSSFLLIWDFTWVRKDQNIQRCEHLLFDGFQFCSPGCSICSPGKTLKLHQVKHSNGNSMIWCLNILWSNRSARAIWWITTTSKNQIANTLPLQIQHHPQIQNCKYLTTSKNQIANTSPPQIQHHLRGWHRCPVRRLPPHPVFPSAYANVNLISNNLMNNLIT